MCRRWQLSGSWKSKAASLRVSRSLGSVEPEQGAKVLSLSIDAVLSKETRYADGMTNNRAYVGRQPMVSSSPLRKLLIFPTVSPCADAAVPLGESVGAVDFYFRKDHYRFAGTRNIP